MTNNVTPLAPIDPKTVTPDGQSITRRSITRDPLNLKIRLYIQISEMLCQLEEDDDVTIRERIAALAAVGRLQGLLIDKSKDEDENVGSAVRKYETAFKNKNVVSNKRKNNARSNPELESDNQWLDRELGIADDPE